jgi:protein tyrosine/serine phosphatase
MKRFLKAVASTAGTTAFVFGGYLGVLQLTGNFHEVLPAELYRSAQPSAADVASYARQYGIKTIVNLRGKSRETWYLQEVEAANRAGISHFDFRWSASKRVSPRQARQLITLLQTAPKPILIHCQAGADRTGLAAMLYLQQIAGIDEEISERQLSVRYGHIGLPYISAAFAMDESWEIFEEVLFGLTS